METDLRDLALDLAVRAGRELVARMGRIEGLETKSTATDPVSDADKAAERLISDGLAEARPDDAVLGEEGTSRPGTSGLRWVVDPLDGTVNYLYGLPGWVVSIGVEDADGGLIGVVHDPVTGRTHHAIRRHGAWRREPDGTDHPVRANDPVALDHALLGTGFPYDRTRRTAMGAMIGALLPEVRDIRRIGVAAADLCRVAEGSLDAMLEEGLNPWDVAAGLVIATEAGAVTAMVPTPGGREALVVAGPALLDPVRRAAATAVAAVTAGD